MRTIHTIETVPDGSTMTKREPGGKRASIGTAHAQRNGAGVVITFRSTETEPGNWARFQREYVQLFAGVEK